MAPWLHRKATFWQVRATFGENKSLLAIPKILDKTSYYESLKIARLELEVAVWLKEN